MRKLVCTLLIVVLTFSSLAIFSPTAKAQASPLRTVWENPYTLTTFHPNNQVNSTFYTFPKVIWNGTQYVDYIFNPADASAGIGSVYLKVSRDSTVFYDPYQKEEMIQDESWIVECLDASHSGWAADFPVECNVYSLVNSSGIYFNRHATLVSGASLDVWYWLRIGSTLKISVVLHPAKEGKFRLLWLLSDVSASKARWLTTTETVSAQVVDDKSCSDVQFAGGNGSRCFVDWSDARFFNRTNQKWETFFQTLELQKRTSDRCQARISFGNFTLPRGESVVVDPTVVTFSSSASLDGWIEREGDSYPPDDESYVDKNGLGLYVGQYNMFPSFPLTRIYHCCRSYLSFDTSLIPALAYNMSAELKLKTYWDDSVVDFTVNVMGGVQPIYKDDLTVDCWGTGTVQLATWNTVDYPGDGIHLNLTVPANQINKAGGTAFELKSNRDNNSIPQAYQDEIVEFYSGNSTGNEPRLEVSYHLDTVTVGEVAWFYRNVSGSKVVIPLFGGHPFDYSVALHSIEIEKLGCPAKVPFLDALVESGFSVLTLMDNHVSYNSSSTWIRDAALWLVDNQSKGKVFMFGFSAGGVVVAYEIQKDYTTRFSAAIVTCAPVNWDAHSNDPIYQSAHSASKAKVAACFPEPIDDDFYDQMYFYYDNTFVHKEWHNWTDGHQFFGQSCINHTCAGPAGENDSVVVIDWFNAAHPPSTPFTASGCVHGLAQTNYTYSSGTVDANGDNVKYQFDWGDGTKSNSTFVSSGTNVTLSHSWNTGTYNVTVRAVDVHDDRWSGWSSNLTVKIGINTAPNTPSTPSGSTNLNRGVSSTYSAVTTDPEADSVCYQFDWDDNSYSTTDWRASGTAGSAQHSWSAAGTYHVKARAKDSPFQAWSNWSSSLTVTVTEPGGGGCPYVSTWNGQDYVRDNNLLPTSSKSNGTDVQDYYKLEHPLVPSYNGTFFSLYQLLISEFESEHSYIDQVNLLAVDHSTDCSIAVTPEGRIVTYRQPSPPISCVDNNGTDGLSQVCSANGNVSDPSTYFYGESGDWLLLNFGRVDTGYAKLILRDDMKCQYEWCCIEVQILNNSQWQTVSVVAPREYWATEAVDLSPYVAVGQELTVRLYWTLPHRLDYVGLDTSPPESFDTHQALLISAMHSEIGNVLWKLLRNDGIYAELVPGQQIRLTFLMPNNQNQHERRTFIFYTEGHYTVIT